MATLEELRDSIKLALDDTSFSDDLLDKILNQGIRFIAGKVLLPELESSGVASSELGVYEITIPTTWTYSRNLYSASVEDADKIIVLNSVTALLEKYPDFETELESGDIKYVVVKGSSLIYYPIPEEIKTINCRFYKKPTAVTKDRTEVSEIPIDVQEELLENFVLWKSYNLIEDGIDGAKVNTKYYENQFKEALSELDENIVVGQSRPELDRTSGYI